MYKFKLPPVDQRKDIPAFYKQMLMETPRDKSNPSAYITYLFLKRFLYVCVFVSCFFLLRYLLSGELHPKFVESENGNDFTALYRTYIALPFIFMFAYHYVLAIRNINPSEYISPIRNDVSLGHEYFTIYFGVLSGIVLVLGLPWISDFILDYISPKPSSFFYLTLIFIFPIACTMGAMVSFGLMIARKYHKFSKGVDDE